MVLMDQFCQAYHWDIKSAMTLTMPQIVLINHASHVNKLRMDKRMEADKKTKERDEKRAARNPVVFKGKTLDQMTTEEQGLYYGNLDRQRPDLRVETRVFTKDD